MTTPTPRDWPICTHKASGAAEMNVAGEATCGKRAEFLIWYTEAMMGYGYVCGPHAAEYLSTYIVTMIRRLEPMPNVYWARPMHDEALHPEPSDFPNYLAAWSFKLLDLVKDLDAVDVPCTVEVICDLGAGLGERRMISFSNAKAAAIKGRQRGEEAPA